MSLLNVRPPPARTRFFPRIVMPNFRCTTAVMLVLLCGATAQAQDPSRSLDSVDTGESKSLDAVDTGESVDPDAVDTGESESLDAAEAPAPAQSAPMAPPAALPEIDDANSRAQAQSAREAVLVAQQRVEQANAAYSSMMTRDYPQGDARAAIVQERGAASQSYQQVSTRYEAILKELQ
jgi:hypothetical protein